MSDVTVRGAAGPRPKLNGAASEAPAIVTPIDGDAEPTPTDGVHRDAEQRLIAYVSLLVAGMAVVGWFAWLVTSARPLFALSAFVLGSVSIAVLSIALAPIAVFLGDRRERDWAIHARQVALALVAGTAAATVYLLVWGADPALVAGGTVAALLAFWVVVPLAIGAIATTTGRRSMHSVLIAWPGTNVLALAAFVAPEPGGGIDFGGSTVTALEEPYRTIGLLVIGGIVTLGPTLVGRVVHRFIRQGDGPRVEGGEGG